MKVNKLCNRSNNDVWYQLMIGRDALLERERNKRRFVNDRKHQIVLLKQQPHPVTGVPVQIPAMRHATTIRRATRPMATGTMRMSISPYRTITERYRCGQ